MQVLRYMLAHLESSFTITTLAFAHSDITASAFSVHSYNGNHPWIIDSGANDHVRGSSHFFSSYSTCSGRDKVGVANGSLSSISGIGSMQCFLIWFDNGKHMMVHISWIRGPLSLHSRKLVKHLNTLTS